MRVSGRSVRWRPAAAALALLAAALVALGGCASTASTAASPAPSSTAVPVHPEVTTVNGARVIPDLSYGHAGGQNLLLDACLPAATAPGVDDPAPRSSVVLIHGGSWTRGDKADAGYRDVCTWLARNGYPTFSIDYRMVPQFVFPAALDDARRAVAWLRETAQLSRFNLDPARIAAFGGSAGGNLAALLGTAGIGPLTRGTRVAAVVDLSGPADLTGADTTAAFLPVQLAFLGCAAEAGCADARAASPIFAVSRDDPPFFIANSTQERIPIAQSERFAAALTKAGVPVTFVAVPGGAHSIAMLGPSMRERILAFYASTVGTNASASPSPAAG